MPRIINIDRNTLWNGVGVPPTATLLDARRLFSSTGLKICLPTGTYKLIQHDNDVALLQPVRDVHPRWADRLWVTPTTNLIKRPPIYSKELPIVVDGQKLDRPSVHPDAPPPGAKLWRYLSFDKFEKLLKQGGIFLSRADMFTDRSEGTLSVANGLYRNEIYKTNPVLAESFTRLTAGLANMKRWTYVSCWRIAEDESAECWENYLGTSEGVAVQTTYQQICRYTTCMFATRVRYIDFEDTWVMEGNSLYPFMHKDRKQFEWENEFRIILQQFPEKDLAFDQVDYYACERENPEIGKVLHVDLTTFVKQIVVAPGSPGEFKRRVALMAAASGLADRIRD